MLSRRNMLAGTAVALSMGFAGTAIADQTSFQPSAVFMR